MYKQFLKPFLFRYSPEDAHHLTMRLFRIALDIPIINIFFKNLFIVKNQRLSKNIAGIPFPNPVGLAAGFDKDGKYLDLLPHLGFGFVEIGTVTPLAQDGNPQPRLFRLPEDEALINRMGFNNEGVDALVQRLKKWRETHPTEGGATRMIVGGNIGKNKITPNENAVLDYEICFEKLFNYVDYFVVNVSSPNTPNLRELQDKEPLTKLLSRIQTLNQSKPKPKPLFLKIAPDVSFSQLDDILSIIKSTKLTGIVATNTTIARNDLKTPTQTIESIGMGGLSGKPVRERATEVIRYLRANGTPNMVIIGVGGIASGKDAKEKLDAGADLVQVYSGLVYEGPALVKNICAELH